MKKNLLSLLFALLIPLLACAQNRPRVSVLGDSYWYDNQDYSARSFITRLPRLGSPDIILIFGGTNDDWAGAELGEYQYDHFTQADFYTYRPALAYLCQQAKERYPNVKILFIINSELRKGIVESTKVICSHYSIPYIELKDIDKKLNHPTVKGMKAIAQQVLEFINK